MRNSWKTLLATIAIAAWTGCATTDDHAGHNHATASYTAGKPYPLKTCIVTDEKLEKDAFVFVHEGQQIKLCCEPCKEDFDKNPAKYLKKIAKK